MPKSFQSIRKTRFERPRPHAEFLVSCAAPGVRPPSPSTTKTLTSPAPAATSAIASPAANGMPWPDGPVLALRKGGRPAISPRPADIPAHRSGEEQREEHVNLGPRAAGMAALAVVEREVDQLVDEILEDL